MDPVTHVLAAITVAELLPTTASEPWAVAAAAGAALAPDVDFIARRFGHTGLLRWHHTLTHSAIGAALLGAAWAGVISLFSALPWVALVPYAAAGVFTHVGLDLILHNNGLMLAWPFSRRMPRGGLFLGLNPLTSSARCGERKLSVCLVCQARSHLHNRVFFLAVATTLVAGALFPYRRYVFAAGFVLTIACVVHRVFLKTRAQALANAVLGQRTAVFPSDFSGKRWLAVAAGGDYRAATIDLKGGVVSTPRSFAPAPEALAAATASRPSVRAFLKNAIIPFTTVSPDGRELWWQDLSYAFSPDIQLHTLRLGMDETGAVVAEEFRERW